MATEGRWTRFILGIKNSAGRIFANARMYIEFGSGFLVSQTDTSYKVEFDPASAAQTSWKSYADARTTSNQSLSPSLPASIGGVAINTSADPVQRFLLAGQTDTTKIGIYYYDTGTGALVRTPDADTDSDLRGLRVYVRSGTGAGEVWQIRNTGSCVPDVDAITIALVEEASDKAKLDGLGEGAAVELVDGDAPTVVDNSDPANPVVQWSPNTNVSMAGFGFTSCTGLANADGDVLISAGDGTAELSGSVQSRMTVGSATLTIESDGRIATNATGGIEEHRAADVLVCTQTYTLAGVTEVFVADIPTISSTCTQSTTGVGTSRAIAAGQGKAGSAGGSVTINVGNGGTPGSDASGHFNIGLGLPVSGATGKQRWRNAVDLVLAQIGAVEGNIEGGPWFELETTSDCPGGFSLRTDGDFRVFAETSTINGTVRVLTALELWNDNSDEWIPIRVGTGPLFSNDDTLIVGSDATAVHIEYVVDTGKSHTFGVGPSALLSITDVPSPAVQVINCPLVLWRVALGSLPAASDWPGGQVQVTDETGGEVPAFSDGTNWRRYTDRAIVS